MIKKMLTKTLLLVISGMVIICGSGCFSGKISQATEDTSKNKIEAAASYIEWSNSWEYGEASVIHTGHGVLYRTRSNSSTVKTVCINAGHGTQGGESVRTKCHPDGSPKVTGGTTSSGSIYATAVSSGTTLGDGTPEAEANLKLALMLKEQLLSAGFNVLMLRETSDVQLDNIARTVMANNNADCHIAIHYDSTNTDKGAFCITVPESAEYRAMVPVRDHWREHERLADCLLSGLNSNGIGLMVRGKMEIDLTQISYSTIPSVDLEVGDKASDRSRQQLERLARGITDGIKKFFAM